MSVVRPHLQGQGSLPAPCQPSTSGAGYPEAPSLDTAMVLELLVASAGNDGET